MLVAVQVYRPMWLWLTDGMVKKLALGPACEVTISPLLPPSDDTPPCKVHLIIVSFLSYSIDKHRTLKWPLIYNAEENSYCFDQVKK